MGDKSEPPRRPRPGMPSSIDKMFTPGPGRIFVFGSNRAGIHGAGAARYAYNYQGAEWEVGEGLAGDSYALPTKGYRLETLPLDEIKAHVDKFLAFANLRPDLTFFVTRIGCGLAGYQDSEIAPMFAGAPSNCELPDKWPREIPPRSIDSFTGAYRFLSNFWLAAVSIYDVKYPSVEHAYQAMKSTDTEYQKQILSCTSPSEAKKLGAFATLRPDWDNVKIDFMRYLVWEKFSKHENLKKRLLDTGTAELVEGNHWGDVFWGVCKGQGQNWLGRILMDTRALLAKGVP